MNDSSSSGLAQHVRQRPAKRGAWRRTEVFEPEVLSDEPKELRGRAVVAQLLRRHLLVFEKEIEQLLAPASPLEVLVHVKIEHAHGADLVHLAAGAADEEVLEAALEDADNRHPLRRWNGAPLAEELERRQLSGKFDCQVASALIHEAD